MQPLALLWACGSALLLGLHSAARMLFTYIRMRRFAANFPLPDRSWPLLGHSFVSVTHPGPGFLQYLLKVLPNTPCTFWVGILPLFVVSDPRDIEKIYMNPTCQRKPGIYSVMECAIGKGLITGSGDLYKRHHKIIAPTFHTKVLDSFVSVFNRQTDVFVSVLNKFAPSGSFDLMRAVERLSLDVVCEAAMGVNVKVQTNEDSEYLLALHKAEEAVMQRALRPWLLFDCLFDRTQIGRQLKASLKVMHDLRDNVITDRRRELEEINYDILEENDGGEFKKRRLAFLDHLLLLVKGGAQLSDQEIADEVDTFMGAGADTTSLMITYAFYELAHSPEIQDKVVEELETIFDPSLETIDVTTEDMSRMTYMEMVLKETMRLHPPVPFSFRLAGQDVAMATQSDLVIPNDAQVVVSVVVAQRNPEFYPDPMKFDPERFSPENSKNRHPCAFIPFSAGQRGCLGRRFAYMEGKTALAKALWHFRVKPAPGHKPIDTWGVTMKPINGVHITLQEKRKWVDPEY